MTASWNIARDYLSFEEWIAGRIREVRYSYRKGEAWDAYTDRIIAEIQAHYPFMSPRDKALVHEVLDDLVIYSP
jgi:hypothetical protein